jgi:hypothetical protein
MNSSLGETPLKLGVSGGDQDRLYIMTTSETGIVNIDCRLISWETYYRLAALRKTPAKRRHMAVKYILESSEEISLVYLSPLFPALII